MGGASRTSHSLPTRTSARARARAPVIPLLFNRKSTREYPHGHVRGYIRTFLSFIHATECRPRAAPAAAAARRCTVCARTARARARAGSSRNACKSHSHTKFIIFPLIFPPSVPTVYMVVSSMARTRDCTSFAFYTLLYSNRILLSPFFPPNSSCCTNEHCSQIISPLTSYRRTIIPPPYSSTNNFRFRGIETSSSSSSSSILYVPFSPPFFANEERLRDDRIYVPLFAPRPSRPRVAAPGRWATPPPP